jgi:hypothetical protein
VYHSSLYIATAAVRTTRVYIPRRGGYGVLIRNLCPLSISLVCSRPSTFVSVEALSTPSLPASHPLSQGCLRLFSRFPQALAFPSVQDDISTLAAILLSTAPSFTNVRLRAGRASPNRSLTEAGVACPKFPRTPQSVYRTGPRFHQDQENHELITGSLVAGFHFRPDMLSRAIITDDV